MKQAPPELGGASNVSMVGITSEPDVLTSFRACEESGAFHELLSMPAKTCWVYIMANPWSRVLYTGVTSNLAVRVWQHKQQTTGFTAHYNVTSLVYFEEHDGPSSAIAREKQIKGWTRAKRLELICGVNREFNDLSDGWYLDSR